MGGTQSPLLHLVEDMHAEFFIKDNLQNNFELMARDRGTYAYNVSSNVTATANVTSGQDTTLFFTTTFASLVSGDDGYCESLDLKTQSESEKTGEFTWDKELQGLLLGSFFWGYLVLQVPGGMLSERYGPRRVVFYTMLPAAVLGLVSPVSARINPWLFLVVRVLIGICESALYPAAQALFARWSPKSERSRLVGVSLSGGQFGNALIFPIGGLLCSSVGWDSVFYVMGAIGFLWCLIWYFLVFDSPALSTRITPLEREYIQHHVTFRDGQKQVMWKILPKMSSRVSKAFENKSSEILGTCNLFRR